MRISGIILVGLLCCLSAQASIFAVQVMDFQFQPAAVDILQGDTVRWIAVNGFHDVHNGCTPPVFSNNPAQAPWTYQWVAAVPVGHYSYVCDLHPYQMQGVVHVHPRGHWDVTVQDFSFTPQSLMISPGDTVIWHDIQGFHSVTHTGNPSLFGFGPANAPWTYQFVFNIPPGPYQYICQVHPAQMQGVVLVVPPQQQGETANNPIPIPSLPFTANGSTIGFCNDIDVACPDSGSQAPDVVYSFTPPQAMQVTVSLCGSDFDTKLYVLNGNTLMGCNDNSCGQASEIQGLALSGGVRYSIVIDGAGGAAGNYLLNLSQFVPCQGTVQVNTTGIPFPPTNVGMTSNQTLLVTNAGTGYLCVSNVTTTGHIWTVSPTTFTLAPGQQQPVTVTFSPTFEHDFSGMIEVISSDAVHLRDSVQVTGTGCRPVIQPPAPRLFDAGSPTDLYFALPWDQNGTSIEYAVEVSQNNFATSQYVKLPFGMGTNPEYSPAGAWGHYGEGLISGLTSGTAYQVRLRARDCTGNEAIGASTTISTRDSIVMNDFLVTVRRLDSATVQLNWDSTLTDTAGNLLSNAGFGVIAGNDPDSITEFLAQTSTGSFTDSVGTHQKRFFNVEPQLGGAYAGAKPFIAWPPDGAVLTGWNTVALGDFVHHSEWDSFQVEIDSAGFAAVIGTNYDNTSDLCDRREISTDFRRFSPGLHQLTAFIIDHKGDVHRDSIHVIIVERPYTTFHADYDSARHLFRCDTADVAGISSGLTDFLWNIERVGQRYGGEVFIPAPSDTDSLTLVVPTPIVNDKILDETGAWFEDKPGENGGVTQQTGHAEIPSTQVSCCCVGIVISTSGISEHKFPSEKDGKRWELGPHATCEHGHAEVDFTFEWTITFATLSEGESANCIWGQDANGTRTITPGLCRPSGFTPQGKSIVLVKADAHGHQFPYGGGRSSDDYRPSHNSGWQNWDDRPGNVIHGLDIVANAWDLSNGQGGHFVGQNSFLLQAGPECPPIPPLKCCLQFEISWDVIFCQDGTIDNAHSVLPHMTNPTPPGDTCPTLAPN